MTDTATLQIRVQSLEAEVAQRRVDGLARSGARAERATDGLTSSFKRFAGPAALVAGSLAGLNKTISTQRSFDILNAQLVTATGSAKDAAVAFGAIQDFAATTPFDLGQVTDSFTKLVNLGLTPSERALTSYGNTASAMGKDLNQLIEAVADAATGEFERLKEFGIKSSKQGDQVAFTFRGMTTTVQNSAEEIEGYLQALGENEFAGAMAERANTLDGAISNLGDSWESLFLTISNQGVGDAAQATVRQAITAVEELNTMLSSGQLPAYLDAYASSFDGFAGDASNAIIAVTGVFDEFFGFVSESSTVSANDMVDAFLQMPQNIRSIIQLLAVEVGFLADVGSESAKAYASSFLSGVSSLADRLEAVGLEIRDKLNPFDGDTFDFSGEIAAINERYDAEKQAAQSALQEKIAGYSGARASVIADILGERDASINSFNEQISAAEKLRESYDAARAERSSQSGDRLEQFKVGGIEQAANDPSAALGDGRGVADFISSLDLGGDSELDRINEIFDRKRELILANTQITEDQRTQLELQLTAQRNAQLEALEMERSSAILSNTSNIFGSLAQIQSNFKGEQNATFQAMFAASKAFAIADSIIKIQQGIAAAASTPWPANLTAISSTLSATSGVLSTINSTNFSGAYDKGGMIPAGKFGLVGEFGPEFIQGPANVTSRRETANAIRDSSSDTGSTAERFTIVNVYDQSIVGQYLATDDGETAVMNILKSNGVV